VEQRLAAVEARIDAIEELLAPSVRKRNVALSTNNLRFLADLMIARSIKRGWPLLSGKRFVLSAVASGDVDVRDVGSLEVFWSPADRTFDRTRLSKLPYSEVTKAKLDEGIDVGGLTSYAGRRNSEEAYRLTTERLAEGVPVLADLHFPDGAIVAFSDRRVEFMTRGQLGLGADDPIVAGDGSKSPILRQLAE
jgi:hypothetical protein